MYAFGVGENKTPIAFRNSCDNFILTENLGDATISLTSNDATKKSTGAIPQEITDILFWLATI